MKYGIGSLTGIIRVPVVLCLFHGGSSSAAALEAPPELLSALSSPEFRSRETAQSKLLEWGRGQSQPAMLELLRLSNTAGDPEVRFRCLAVLREMVDDLYYGDGEGYIGISMKDEMVTVPGDPQQCGAIRVSFSQTGSGADLAGIKADDLIVHLNGQYWHGEMASIVFRDKVRSLKPRSKIKLGLLRGGKVQEVEVTLGRRPASADQTLLLGRNLMLDGTPFDPEAMERAAREAYFRKWLSEQEKP